jgi:hypothetical protein
MGQGREKRICVSAPPQAIGEARMNSVLVHPVAWRYRLRKPKNSKEAEWKTTTHISLIPGILEDFDYECLYSQNTVHQLLKEIKQLDDLLVKEIQSSIDYMADSLGRDE